MIKFLKKQKELKEAKEFLDKIKFKELSDGLAEYAKEKGKTVCYWDLTDKYPDLCVKCFKEKKPPCLNVCWDCNPTKIEDMRALAQIGALK